MTYQCPECEHKPFATLPGWKRHMTSIHDGYTAEQLDEVNGGGQEGVALSGEKDLTSAVESLGDTEESTVDSDEEEAPRLSAEQRKAIKQASKRIRARLDSLKEKISKDVPADAFKFAGVELKEDESQWLSDSIGTAMDVFGVEFEVEPKSMTIRNPWLVLLYPIVVIGYIIMMHLFRMSKDEENKQQEFKWNKLGNDDKAVTQ